MLRRCVVAWAWLTHDPSGPQGGQLVEFEPLSYDGETRWAFAPVLRARDHSLYLYTQSPPVLLAGRGDELHHHPPGVFHRSAPKNASMASCTSTTPRGDADTFAQPQACTNTSPCQRVSCLVPVWLFEPAQRPGNRPIHPPKHNPFRLHKGPWCSRQAGTFGQLYVSANNRSCQRNSDAGPVWLTKHPL